MTDKFLELFKASYTRTEEEEEVVYEIKLDIDRVVADIRLPNDLAVGASPQSIGQLIIERIIIDLTEGVTESLNKVDSDMFPSFADYKLP